VVTVAVQGHRVAGGDDLARAATGAAHLLADEEEGRARGGALQRAEHRRRAARVRPVVEGQGHARPRRSAWRCAARVASAGACAAAAGADHVAAAAPTAKMAGRMSGWSQR
jgi:hypothetical protein